MREKPIPYGRQHITDEDVAAVFETLRSDFLTQGPKIEEFERKFADYVGARHAVAVNNATSGLHLAARALGVAPGQRVIVTPMTFAASANCIRYCGGDVTFCDIDPDTYLMDEGKLSALLESNPRGTFAGIVVVDFAGYPHNLERLRAIADRHGLWIIEDACHAPGAWWTDSAGHRHTTGEGSLADCCVFSFHPVKHIATGEGGMVTTDSPELLERLRLFRTHGITRDPARLSHSDGGWYYEMQELGFNYRLTDFQAALGISQFDRAASRPSALLAAPTISSTPSTSISSRCPTARASTTSCARRACSPRCTTPRSTSCRITGSSAGKRATSPWSRSITGTA